MHPIRPPTWRDDRGLLLVAVPSRNEARPGAKSANRRRFARLGRAPSVPRPFDRRAGKEKSELPIIPHTWDCHVWPPPAASPPCFPLYAHGPTLHATRSRRAIAVGPFRRTRWPVPPPPNRDARFASALIEAPAPSRFCFAILRRPIRLYRPIVDIGRWFHRRGRAATGRRRFPCGPWRNWDRIRAHA